MKKTAIAFSVFIFSFLIIGILNVSTGQLKESSRLVVQSAADRILIKYKKQTERTIQESIKFSIEYAYGIQEIKHFSFIDVYLYSTFGNKEGKIEELNKNPNIAYAEPDYIVHIASTYPNDPFWTELWGLHNTGQTGGAVNADINVPEAWDFSTGSSEVIVAVNDTGVDYDHPDLNANMWINPFEIPDNGIDDDGNGYVDDYYGINVITDSGDPMDDNSHGTHCAGIIAAAGNNEIGVVGVCWTAKIMALKFLSSEGEGFVSDAIECIGYAIDKGVHIINASYGSPSYSQAEKDAVEALEASGIIFVAAAGNDGLNNNTTPFYPSSYDCDNIISVAATDHFDNLCAFSNYGNLSVDVAAPGEQILSAVPTWYWGPDSIPYGYASGTSMAAPHVTGLAALIKSYRPTISWQQIKNFILNGADNRPSLNGKLLTEGRINAYNSLKAYMLTIAAESGGSTEPVPGTYFYDEGTEVSITASPESGYRFGSWTGNIPQGHEDDNPIIITMDSDRSITANFVQQYTLTIDSDTGGTTNPEPGSYAYDSGADVTITAIPDSGYRFQEWNGDASGTDNPITITMDSDKNVTSIFIRQYQLTIAAGTGGTTNPSPGSYAHDTGESVSVRATPNSGYEFTDWSRDASGTSNPITMTMDSDKSVTANFKKKGPCFIATAAYGSPFHPYVEALRDFRDNYLMTNKLGRMFVDFYYEYSPFVANLIARHKVLKVAVRFSLMPVIIFSYSMLHFGPIITAIILVFIFILPIFLVSFRQRKTRRVEAKSSKALASRC